MTNRVALVTAAGKGIGAAIARALHAEGYRLALLSPSGNVEKLAQELGGRAVTGSVSAPADLERLVKTALDAYGRIDVVVTAGKSYGVGDGSKLPYAWKTSPSFVAPS